MSGVKAGCSLTSTTQNRFHLLLPLCHNSIFHWGLKIINIRCYRRRKTLNKSSYLFGHFLFFVVVTSASTTGWVSEGGARNVGAAFPWVYTHYIYFYGHESRQLPDVVCPCSSQRLIYIWTWTSSIKITYTAVIQSISCSSPFPLFLLASSYPQWKCRPWAC